MGPEASGIDEPAGWTEILPSLAQIKALAWQRARLMGATFVLAWLAHTYVVIVKNDGWDKSGTYSDWLNTSSSGCSSLAAWGLTSALLWSLIFAARDRGIRCALRDLAARPFNLWRRLTGARPHERAAVMVGVGVTLVLHGVLGINASVGLATGCLWMMLGPGSMGRVAVRVATLAWQRRPKLLAPEGPRGSDLSRLVRLAVAGIAPGSVAAAALQWVYRAIGLVPSYGGLGFYGSGGLLSASTALIATGVAVIGWVARRRAGGAGGSIPPAKLGGMMALSGLWAAVDLLVATLGARKAQAHDGGWQESGGSVSGLWQNEGTFTAIRRGIVPAGGAALGPLMPGLEPGDALSDPPVAPPGDSPAGPAQQPQPEPPGDEVPPPPLVEPAGSPDTQASSETAPEDSSSAVPLDSGESSAGAGGTSSSCSPGETSSGASTESSSMTSSGDGDSSNSGSSVGSSSPDASSVAGPSSDSSSGSGASNDSGSSAGDSGSSSSESSPSDSSQASESPDSSVSDSSSPPLAMRYVNVEPRYIGPGEAPGTLSYTFDVRLGYVNATGDDAWMPGGLDETSPISGTTSRLFSDIDRSAPAGGQESRFDVPVDVVPGETITITYRIRNARESSEPVVWTWTVGGALSSASHTAGPMLTGITVGPVPAGPGFNPGTTAYVLNIVVSYTNPDVETATIHGQMVARGQVTPLSTSDAPMLFISISDRADVELAPDDTVDITYYITPHGASGESVRWTWNAGSIPSSSSESPSTSPSPSPAASSCSGEDSSSAVPSSSSASRSAESSASSSPGMSSESSLSSESSVSSGSSASSDSSDSSTSSASSDSGSSSGSCDSAGSGSSEASDSNSSSSSDSLSSSSSGQRKMRKFQCRSMGGFGMDIPLTPISAGFLEVQVQELLLRPDAQNLSDLNSYDGGRVIQLTFAGATKGLSLLPFSWSGQSSWYEIRTRDDCALEDFVGPGVVTAGGLVGGSYSVSVTIVYFEGSGGMCNIADAPGIDASVPVSAPGYWRMHGSVQPRFGSTADSLRFNEIRDEEMRKYRTPLERILNLGRIAAAANRRFDQELTEELSTLLADPAPSADNLARRQEVLLSLERVRWQYDQIGR